MKKCITTPLDVLILNKDLKDALVDSVKHAIVNAGANTLCYKIGEIYGAKKRADEVTALDYALHKGSHAVVGFVSSAALGGNRNKHFGAGLGAMMAEIAGDAIIDQEDKQEAAQTIAQEVIDKKIPEKQQKAYFYKRGKEIFAKKFMMAKVIGTTAGALFFKRDGAQGAEQGAVRAVDYNTTGCLAALDYTDPSVVRYLESIDPQILAEIGFTIASLTPGGKLLKGGKQALQTGSQVVKKVISRVVPKKALQKIAKPFSKPKTQKPVDYNKISTAKPDQSAQPRDLNEQVVWNQVKRNPEAGKALKDCNNDPRFLTKDGWQKMEVIHKLPDNETVILHYQFNKMKKQIVDMKLTSKKPNPLQPKPSFKDKK